MKKVERNKARELRKSGQSIKKIAKILDVSQSSVSLWVRDIQLTKEQIENLKLRHRTKTRKGGYFGKQEKYSEKFRRKRRKWQTDGRALAKISESFRVGCILYWAEGTKESNKGVTFCNSDIDMMILFMKFLREHFEFEEKRFALSINAYTNNGVSEQEIVEFWLNALSLTKENLRKCYFKSSEFQGKLKYGICTVRLHSVEIKQKIMGGIQEIGGFKRDKWLG